MKTVSYDSRRPCEPIVEPSRNSFQHHTDAAIIGYAADYVEMGLWTPERALRAVLNAGAL